MLKLNENNDEENDKVKLYIPRNRGVLGAKKQIETMETCASDRLRISGQFLFCLMGLTTSQNVMIMLPSDQSGWNNHR